MQAQPQYLDSQTQTPPQDFVPGLPQNMGATAGTVSPYQQQEQAIQQARMQQQLEEQARQQREYEASCKYGDPQTNSMPGTQGKGKFKKMVGGLGSIIKTGVSVAAPVAVAGGGMVGTYFLMRAATQGQPMGFAPMMAPMGGGMMGGMMMPVYGR